MATTSKGKGPEDEASKNDIPKFNTDKTVKLNDLKPFTGKREELGKFLRDVALHIAVNDHIFTNDIKKIAFVLSYMTEGDAAQKRRIP